MTHGMDHAAQRLGIRLLDRLADTAQPDRAQRVPLAAVRAVGRLDLGDHERAHGVATSSVLSTASASVSVSTAATSPLATTGLPPRPNTLSTDKPRSAAISSGLRRSCRPAIVALTRLIGFCEPSDFERMSWIPASSSTACTPPPAITPVPGEAGFGNPRPASRRRVLSWVFFEPCRGSRNRFFFARSTPYWIASGTSL